MRCQDPHGYLGSSKYFNKSHVPKGGLLSPDSSTNPRFFAWNRVQIRYCDGGSFTGYRPSAVPVKLANGEMQDLYVRGRTVLQATLRAPVADHGLGDAQHVMPTGDSAGGLAVFHAADRVGDFLRQNAPVLRTHKVPPYCCLLPILLTHSHRPCPLAVTSSTTQTCLARHSTPSPPGKLSSSRCVAVLS